MGSTCACYKTRTSHENIVDEIFLALPLRKLSIDKINEVVQSQMTNQQISETVFQKICNKICSIEEKKAVLHNYWGTVYHNTPKKKSNLFLVFTLYLLCNHHTAIFRHNLEKLVDLFDLYYGDSNTNTETETEGFVSAGGTHTRKKNVKIVGVELREVLFSHFKTISYLTIDHFDTYSSDKEGFRDYLRNVWNPAKIWRFITEKFFDKNNLSKQIDFRKFLVKHLNFLMNDSLIRKELTDFEYKEAREGEEYLDTSKYRDKN